MKKYLIIIFMALWVTGCTSNAQPITSNAQATVKVIEVAPTLADCVGVAPMKCMQIREEGQREWTFMYDQIEGFEFEPGYTYQLQVRITPRENVPADASSLSWSLIKIISRTK